MGSETMRLIDADKLIADLKAMSTEFDSIMLTGLIQGIKSRPTVDAVEVTRCKDCIMAMKLGDRAKMIFADDALKCSLTGCIMLANGFCSYGEKPEGKNE